MVIVSVKDTCSGINTALLPKLFTTFISKSFNGVDFGLYVYIKKNSRNSWWKNIVSKQSKFERI